MRIGIVIGINRTCRSRNLLLCRGLWRCNRYMRSADTRSLIRAIRIADKVEPLFVESTDVLPQAILDVAKAGDVVIVMGAGSIGQVAAKTKLLAEGAHIN